MKKRRLRGCLVVCVLLLLAGGCTRDSNQSVLFQDDFDSPGSGWSKDTRERFERGYEEGEYFIKLEGPHWFAWAHPGRQFDDVSVEVDAYLASGAQDSHFGVLCRHVDLGNFYYFAISPDGYYAIFRRVDSGDLEVLTGDGSGMTFSPTIKTGHAINHVAAVCQGNELRLYVNDELLEAVTDDTYTHGDVGVGAGSGGEGEVLVRFDNFLVSRP